MRMRNLVFLGPGMLAVFVLALVFTLLVLKLLWSWTIPDLMPGAVEQGLVAGTISWWSALKLAIFIAFLTSIMGLRNKGK